MGRSFKFKPSTVYERFGDETIIVNLESGTYYSALGVGSAICSLVGDGTSEANILRRIRTEFSGNSNEILRGTAQFLDQLVEEALVDPEYVASSDCEQAGDETRQLDKVFSAPLLQKYTDMEEMLLLDPIHEVDEQGWPSARKSPE